MSPITTHVLDISAGQPAEGVAIRLETGLEGAWTFVGEGVTNSEGRLTDLMAEGALRIGIYRITFLVAPYYAARKIKSFYPFASIVFEIADPSQHYHVPLLLSPFGYSTYRGS